MADVKFIRKELGDKLEAYTLIKDCLAGQKAIKDKGTEYLPQPDASNRSPANTARYTSYLQRALFYNVVQRTLIGLVGQIFMREPRIILPTNLKVLETDANGTGLGLVQLAKRDSLFVLGYGRSGIFVDYPFLEKPLTIAQQREGFVNPTLTIYEPWRIINWRTVTKGSKTLLSLIVLEEDCENFSDEFSITVEKRYRVLRLGKGRENNFSNIVDLPNVYTVEIYTCENNSNNMTISESYQPKNAKGEFLTEIPFSFIGSENNDIVIDNPPAYDMCVLNIAHYLNSADYEEACFMVGQPTPYLSGLTKNWVDTVLKGRIELGSRGAIMLPEKGTAGLLQAKSNTMPIEAMMHKEEQMLALGAKLVNPSNVERTATEVTLDKSSETSVLSSSAKNISDAFTKALKWADSFTSTVENEVSFKLSDDFKIASMGSEDRRQLLADFIGGLISWTEARENLRRSNVTSQDDETALSEIEAEKAKKDEVEMKKETRQAELVNNNVGNSKNNNEQV